MTLRSPPRGEADAGGAGPTARPGPATTPPPRSVAFASLAPSSRSTTPPSARKEELVFSARLVIPLLTFFEERHGRAALTELCAALGTSLATLEDPDRWFSASVVSGLTRAMVDRTRDPFLPYDAGLALSSRKIVGPVYHVVRAIGSPGAAYARMPEYAPQLSKITTWAIESVTDRRAVLRFTIAPGHEDDPLFCLNRRGALAGIPAVFDLPHARVEDPLCIHRGDPCCEYVVSWVPRSLGTRLTSALGVASAVAFPAAAWLVVTRGALVAAPWLAAWAAAGLYALAQRRQRRIILDATSAQIVDLKKLLEDNQRRTQELVLLERVDELTRRELEVDTLVDTALKEITTTLGYDRALLMRVDRDRGRLGMTRSVGFEPDLQGALTGFHVDLDPPSEDGRFFANVLKRDRGVVVEDVEGYGDVLSAANRELLATLGARSFAAVPVSAGGEALGLLVVDQVGTDRRVGARDLPLLERLGHLVGLALSNARLVENLRKERENLQNSLLLNQKFGHYLPRNVVERLRQDPGAALRLGGQRIRAAILFSDVVGFTPWSEPEEPETVVAFLNWYFAAMDRVIEQTRGIVDKRIGDGLMVVFLANDEPASTREGAIDRLNPARRALDCGIRMQKAVLALTKQPDRPRADAFAIRIGISYGELVAGNIGSAHRLEYTVIGDVVNVASRLEGQCVPGSVYATALAVEAAGPGFEVRPRGELEVKGRRKPVPTFEILGTTP